MSDLRLQVLHGLRVRGWTRPAVLAEATGLDESLVEVVLDSLLADGLVDVRTGSIEGAGLTAAGKAEHLAALAAELDDAGVRDEVAPLYERFLARNGDVVQVCTDVQLDPAGAGAAVERLAAIHADAVPVCEGLTDLLPRFGRYAARLSSALDRARAGDLSFVADPFVPSYHTVWFELHEDLLCTLGLER